MALGALLLSRPRMRTLTTRSGVAAGAIVAAVLPFVITGNVERAALLAARAAAAVTVAIAVGSTLKQNDLAPALAALGVPGALTRVVATMARQLGSVTDQGRRLVLARNLRGSHGSAVGVEVIATLLLRTAARAERVDLAERLRGGPPPARRARLRLSDAPFLVGCVALAVATRVVA
jgi:energy-coupling factor transporter transmembrane protein EcfT